MRAGGDKRSNNRARARRKRWMLATYSPELGPERAQCQLGISANCRGILTVETVTADRLDPTGSYMRSNIQPACVPCQNRQGALITQARRHQWHQWRREADDAGVEWDGSL